MAEIHTKSHCKILYNKVPVQKMLFVILAALILIQTAAAGLYEPERTPFVDIVKAGKSQTQIITPDEPTYLEQFAATELQSYLEKISGVRIPIISETGSGKLPYSFFIGATQKSDEIGFEANEESMGRDGFELRSIIDGIIIRGRDDLGSVFGVYELLERYFDVRWFMPDEIGEHIPKSETLSIGKVQLVFKPSFRFRWVGDGTWALHQRMNAYVKAGQKDVGIICKWNCHTFFELVPPEKYYDQHPEYYAMVKGKREIKKGTSHSQQLCTTNPDVIKIAAESLIKTLDADPNIEIIALWANDGSGFCECEKCCALDEYWRDWFGKHSRRFAIFNNEVAKIVKQKHPSVLIKTGAYAMYARPPLDKDYKPEDNIVYQLCHLYFCHNHPLGSNMCKVGETYEPADAFKPNQEFCRILDRWLKISPHLFIYEYYAIGGMQRAKLPWPLIHTIRSDIPYYRDRGVEGFYTQLNNDSWYRLGLNFYLAAKLCWNADLDVEALLGDYFDKFYGPAAVPMKDYFMTMERAMQSWNGCSSYGFPDSAGGKVGLKIFKPKVMEKMLTCLEQAEKLSIGDETIAKRVGMARRMYTETEESLATVIKDKSLSKSK